MILIINEMVSFKNKKEEIKELQYQYEETQDSELEIILKDIKASDLEDIQNKIGLLKKEVSDNDEALDLFYEDIERLKNQNNELEQKIIYLKQLKSQKIINGIITYAQFPNYPTGCESIALYILLKYYQISVSPNDIINNLKKGELPYYLNGTLYGGNPEREFIGNPLNNYSYGVYNNPIADVANKYKEGALSKINFNFDEVLKLIDDNRPVIVWTTINLIKPIISKSWIDRETLKKINWISGEHALVVIGYNEENIIASDPYTGTIRYFDKNTFINRYNYLGKRVVYY